LPSVEKLHVNSICAPFGEAGWIQILIDLHTQN
jgi:hypothetical protein